MDNIYPTALLVSPFIICPGHKEATILVGPEILAEHGDNLVRHLYGPLAEMPLHFPIFAQLSKFREKILFATTIRTGIPDPVAGRQGQKLSIGAWASPEVFIGAWGPVCFSTFNHLSYFLQATTGKRLEDGGGDALVSNIQDNTISQDLPLGNLEDLLRCFAVAFWPQSRDMPSLSQRLLWKIRTHSYLSKFHIQPGEKFADIVAYWQYADLRLAAARVDAG